MQQDSGSIKGLSECQLFSSVSRLTVNCEESDWLLVNLYLTRLLFGVRVHPTEFPFKSLRVSDNKRLYLVNRR